VKFHVYILMNPAGSTYVGQTADLEQRLIQHNDPNCRFTSCWSGCEQHKYPEELTDAAKGLQGFEPRQ
jgi:predicted GIY-YIG superfamily endonuclease